MDSVILINGRALVPIDETSQFLGIEKGTLYNYASRARRGLKIPVPAPRRVGSKLLWDAQELHEYIDSLK